MLMNRHSQSQRSSQQIGDDSSQSPVHRQFINNQDVDESAQPIAVARHQTHQPFNDSQAVDESGSQSLLFTTNSETTQRQ
jgi:hypothetical protein